MSAHVMVTGSRSDVFMHEIMVVTGSAAILITNNYITPERKICKAVYRVISHNKTKNCSSSSMNAF